MPKDDEHKKGSDKPPEEAKSNFYNIDHDSYQFQANIKNEDTTSLQVSLCTAWSLIHVDNHEIKIISLSRKLALLNAVAQ